MVDSINKTLLPDFLKKPVILLWLFVIPQLVLLFINLGSYWLINEEVAKENIYIAQIIFACEVGLILLAVITWLLYRIRKINFGFGMNSLFLIAHIVYLWHVSVNLWRVIPTNIEFWILDQGSLMLYQFTFIMPGLFYAGLRVSCFEVKLKYFSDWSISLLIGILAPLGFYLIFIALAGFTRFWEIPTIISVIFFIVLTVMAYFGFVRFIILSYNGLRAKGDLAQTIFAIVIALVGPIAGLLLNISIPFPADFQSPWVYCLAVINGLVVIIPSIKKSWVSELLLLARSLMYPFSLYFFLVFLPFLPLSLPAMFAVGMGFLILVPVALFLIHTKRLYDDSKFCIQQKGVVLAVILILSGLLILPSYFVLDATSDKVELKKALDYVYSADYKMLSYSFKGSAEKVSRTLIKLKHFKEGIQLPYLSGFYNRIVFEGMVLPDQKIEYMYKLFSGEDIKKEKRAGRWGYGFSRGAMRSGRAGIRIAMPERNVELVSFNVNSQVQGDITESRIRLEMLNKGRSNAAEFFKHIYIPEGVLITGFDLMVEGKMVKGKIFEKRTAMWVYHMIRDFTRRDPGILTYKTPTLVNINVYPFLKDQTRVAEIEFQFPTGFKPTIIIGDEPVELANVENEMNAAIEDSKIVSDGHKFLLLDNEDISVLPKLTRKPYLHFILDFSKGSKLDNEKFVSGILSVAEEYNDIKIAKVVAANIDLVDLSQGFVNLEDREAIARVVSSGSLSHRGSLDLDRVIKHQLKQFKSNYLETPGSLYWQYYPLFVIVTDNKSDIYSPEDLTFFKDYLPDCNYYLILNQIGKIERKYLWQDNDSEANKDVVILKSENAISVMPANTDSIQLVGFKQNNNTNKFFVYNPNLSEFEEIKDIKLISNNLKYVKGVDLLLSNLEILTNPTEYNSRLASLVSSSKDSGVMLPSTSYIIVERSSQWKTLDVKQKQLLSASSGLEFEEDFKTPEPSFWILLSIFMLLYYKKFKKIIL